MGSFGTAFFDDAADHVPGFPGVRKTASGP